ncbi:MAG: glycosyltransferase [Chthoniobacteraceae bacterium]|jgi:glycosyltransferase involved in cell wall biosynthesis
MRLLIVDEEIIAGGVDTLRRQLIPELAKLLDLIVWVLPLHAADQFRDLAKTNIIIETLNSPAGLARIKEGVTRRLGGIPRSLIDERLRYLSRRHNCHVCMTTCAFGQDIPDINLPIVAWVSDVNPALPGQILSNIQNWIEQSAATFAISDFTCSELKNLKPDCSQKIFSIPHAPPAEIHPSNGIPGAFYYPAAPNKHKGHQTLLQAANALAARGLKFHLTLTGAGMNHDAVYCGNIRKKIGSVTLAGDLPPSEVNRHFAETSCVVLPSHYEGFGLPLVEALSHGKPVICSDIPPFREQIKRYECQQMSTFFPTGDARSLEDAMATHLSGNQRLVFTAEDLTARLKRWTWADAARRCKALLETLHA